VWNIHINQRILQARPATPSHRATIGTGNEAHPNSGGFHNQAAPEQNTYIKSNDGWAYAARTLDKDIFLAYFHKVCPRSLVRGTRTMSLYRAQRFDPRNGTWKNVNGGQVQADPIGEIQLPDFPADMDWV
jgi:hypothetical protein